MTELFRVGRLIRPYWKSIIQSLLIGLGTTLLSLPGPYITKILIDDVYPKSDFSLLYFVLALGAAISIFIGLVQSLNGFFGTYITNKMSYNFEKDFFEHLQSLDFGFYDNRETGEILSRFGDMQTSVSQVVGIFCSLVNNIIQLAIFPVVLFFINWKLALISMVVLPFDTILVLWTKHYVRKLSNTIAEKSAEMKAKTIESISGIRTVQALNVESVFLHRIFHIFLELAHLNLKWSVVQNVSGFASTLIRTAGSLVYGWYGWTQVLQGNISLGGFLAFSSYVGFLYGPIERLIHMVPQVESAKVHANRFFEIFDFKPAVVEKQKLPEIECQSGGIVFENVSFSYAKNNQVLQNINLEIEGKSMVALVGHSGSGKSTLVKLLARFYDPVQGTIKIDGQDILTVRLRSVRSKIGFALQNSTLFQGTILFNLTFGTDVSMQHVETAARAAHAHEFITLFPEGYDTIVGEQGVQLSEGQRQRISLARVLILNRPILILDEPTSSLDSESEFYIQKALDNIRKERTVVIIAHKLATIQGADMIVVMDNGKIVESGTHEELMSSGESYLRLTKPLRN